MVGTCILQNVKVLGCKHNVNDRDAKNIVEWDTIHYMSDDFSSSYCTVDKDLVPLVKKDNYYHLVIQLTERASGNFTKTAFKCVGVIDSGNKDLISLEKLNNVSK